MAGSPPRRPRSRSPQRRAPRGSKGFRWKDSSRRDDAHGRRDYRDRSPGRERRRDWDGDRERDRERGGDREREGEPSRDRERRLRSPRRHESGSKDKGRKDKKAAVPAGPGQEMIVVNVNDRLGTKSAIPCLPSDTIGQLKLMVAARIGREAGQIMLRRQGERPFKDHLSLEDYGISNGVQLDLEMDTGD